MESLAIQVGEEVVETIRDIKFGRKYQIVRIVNDEIIRRGVEFKVTSLNGSSFGTKVLISGWTDRYDINDYLTGELRLVRKN